MFLQIIFVAAVAFSGSFVNGQIDTSSCTTYDTAVTACNAPLSLTDVNELNYGSVIGALTTDITPWCGSNRAQYRTLIICVLNAYRACGTLDSMKLIADASEYGEAFDEICNNMADFSAECVDANSINTCATAKLTAMNLTMPATTADFAMLKTYYCGFANYFEECIKTNVGLIGCTAKPRTQAIYLEALQEIKAPECGAMSVVYTSLLLAGSVLLNYIL